MKAIEAFFPPCAREDCPKFGTRHADILDHQQELLDSRERFVALIGGYGSGKTMPASALVVRLCLQIDGNIFLVARRSYAKLHDTTLRAVIEILQRLGIEFKGRENRDGMPHRIILPNDSEIHFRETKDLGRFLGPEYGGFYIDEASEEPKKTWVDLVGRLRLPHARGYLKGFITSNPPHQNHWIAEVFGLTPGVTERRDAESGRSTKYRLIRASTRLNPFLPASYIADLSANNPPSEVKRIIEGHYGFQYEGKAVYQPPFSFERHVAELEPIPGYTVLRSWDFGYHSPAVTWHQFWSCKKGAIHWNTIHEYLGKDIDAEDLARVVLSETTGIVPWLKPELTKDCGDRAGAQVSDKGPGPIIRLARKPFNIHFTTRQLPNIDPGLALVRDVLRMDCDCGLPRFQISRNCKHVIDGFAGGYHYPTIKSGMSDRSLKPVKDGFYDNPMDTIRYAAECKYRGLLTNPHVLEELMIDQTTGLGPSRGEQPPWSWMDAMSA